jgi:DNA-binding transcriptional MerR regulator
MKANPTNQQTVHPLTEKTVTPDTRHWQSSTLTQSPLLRIGEVSSQSGLPIKTIRFYCDEGLILENTRSEGGYRLFDQQVFDDLALIKTLKVLDTPLNQIRSLLQSRRSGICHCNDLKNSLVRKVTSLEDRIQTLNQMRASLQELLNRWQDCGGIQQDNNG